jgi:hypothetical protein
MSAQKSALPSSDIDGVHLMLEEAARPGRRFRTVPLERLFGRGVNFQIEVANVDALHERVRKNGVDLIIPIEECWYRRDDMELGNRQFTVLSDLEQRAVSQ